MNRLRQILIALTALMAVPLLFFAFGSPGGPITRLLGFISTAAACCLVGYLLVTAARRFSTSAWLMAGLLLLASQFIPTALLVSLDLNLPPNLSDAQVRFLGVLLYLIIPAALITAALLLHHGMTLTQNLQRARKDDPTLYQADRLRLWLAAAGCVLLAVLLLGKTTHSLYWLMVWDNTNDPIEFFWLFAPVMAALFAGVMLTFARSGSARLAGGYVFLVPVVLIAVSILGQNVDFRQFTEQRAAQVNRAIESYYAREGRYPHSLRELTPWYTLSLPGPVVISARQGWCYDGGERFYRLGYVDRQHWSDPNIHGAVYAQQGSLPELPPICSLETAGIAQHDPGLYRVSTK